MHIGIIGAGISGRILAWQLSLKGEKVCLFDKGRIFNGYEDNHAAAFTAAGMLSPVSEADLAEELIVKVGKRSLALWPELVNSLQEPIDFRQDGSLILAHRNDEADLKSFCQHVARFPGLSDEIQNLNRAQLESVEPEVSPSFRGGVYIPGESWVCVPQLMDVLAKKLQDIGAELLQGVDVDKITPGAVHAGTQKWTFDSVIDCRGLGAKPDLGSLRGVRGETVSVHAPEVALQHVVRLMHPRYRIYIVPRENSNYVVGATQIESASTSPITVRSALELLSALYSVHRGFAEASILDCRVNCRPALPDNLPLIQYREGLIRVNGLFRHGILLSPAVLFDVQLLLGGDTNFDSDIPREYIGSV